MRMFVLQVGDGTRYYMRGCALRGRVSRKQGRDCIERLGKCGHRRSASDINRTERVQ